MSGVYDLLSRELNAARGRIKGLEKELVKANERIKGLERELLSSATIIEENSNLNVLAGIMREVANSEQLHKELE